MPFIREMRRGGFGSGIVLQRREVVEVGGGEGGQTHLVGWIWKKGRGELTLSGILKEKANGQPL